MALVGRRPPDPARHARAARALRTETRCPFPRAPTLNYRVTRHSERIQEINTSTPTRDLALNALVPRDDSGRPSRLSAVWASTPTFLRGRSGLLILAAAIAATGLLAGWAWLGAAAVLPLLYTLPCAAMMAMCMKGHGGSDGNASTKPGIAASPDGSPSH